MATIKFDRRPETIRSKSSFFSMGTMIALLIYPCSKPSSYESRSTSLVSNTAINEHGSVSGKPSDDEIRHINFIDSIRNDSLEKNRVATRKMNEQAVMINANQSDCIVSLISNGACLVNTAKFNSRVVSSTGKTRFSELFRKNPDSVISIRKSLLNTEIDNSFASQIYDNKIRNPYLEEVDQKWRERLIEKEEEIGKKRLESIYQEYLSILDRSNNRYVSLMGSSDSAALDSLIRISLDSIWDDSRSSQSANAIRKTKPLWSTVERDQLPTELNILLDTLPSDVLSPIQKTKVGWFACSIRRTSHHLVSYMDALPLLIEIAAEGDINSVLLKYDQKNISLIEKSYRSEVDLVPIKIWLAPNEIMRSGLYVSGLKPLDTLRVKPLTANLSDLPFKMRNEVGRSAMNRSSMILSNQIGRWYIQFPKQLSTYTPFKLAKTDSSEKPRIAFALNSFQRDIYYKNNERKLSLYQSFSDDNNNNPITTIKESWIKNQIQINWHLINQTP